MATLTGAQSSYAYKGWIVSNNVYNAGGLVYGSDYSVQTTYSPTDPTDGVVFSWSLPSNGSSVIAYPELLYGPSPNLGGTDPTDTTHALPVQLNSITSASVSYNLVLGGNTAGYAVALDLWLTNQPNGGPNSIATEIEVWVHKGAVNPSGLYLGVYQDANYNVSIYYQPIASNPYSPGSPSFKKLTLVSNTDTLGGTFDVSSFIGILKQNGLVTGQEYLSDIELGAMVEAGQGSLTVNNFSASISTVSNTYTLGSGTWAASGPGLSATTDNGASTLNAGHLVTLKLVGTSAYTVTGTPTLQLNDNETAIYSSGSGTNTLTFTYMVQPGDSTPDLQVTGLNLPNGASIVDATGASPSATISQDLAIRIDTSTSSATSVQQEVMGLYGALYGRAGEFPAYSFWVGYAGAGLNTGNAGSTAVTLAQATTLGQGFVNSQNTFFNQTYGALNDSQFINAMYVNIGGAAGDPNGIGYWSGLLAQAEAQGQSVQAARAGLVGQFVQVLVGFDTSHRLAGLTDQQWADALTRTETISNKIAVSLAYANASNGTGGSILIPAAVGDAAYNAAVKVLQGVTADPHTVAVALAGISNAVSHHDLSLIG